MYLQFIVAIYLKLKTSCKLFLANIFYLFICKVPNHIICPSGPYERLTLKCNNRVNCRRRESGSTPPPGVVHQRQTKHNHSPLLITHKLRTPREITWQHKTASYRTYFFLYNTWLSCNSQTPIIQLST